MHWLTRLESNWFRRPFTRWFVKHFAIDLGEAVEENLDNYPTFNAFFTRALKPTAREFAAGSDVLACPVDGTVSQIGELRNGSVLQAKGHDYSVRELLGDRADLAELFDGGLFATIYLAPYNYHRIHMPTDGVLTETIYVPGRLFSVNAATARAIPRLFARNERVACMFDTAAGPMAMVLVGALFVGSIETVWAGEVTPPHRGATEHRTYIDDGPELTRGAEMGRFNMGSTVILLLPKARAEWDPQLRSGETVRLGMSIGRVTESGKS
ncbi:MAG: phosphatidylserine decarboxylase [Chromatiales bacterium]|nr:MAG: phosphatidylserine decarboxylase [Chromatiales bacterium]